MAFLFGFASRFWIVRQKIHIFAALFIADNEPFINHKHDFNEKSFTAITNDGNAGDGSY